MYVKFLGVNEDVLVESDAFDTKLKKEVKRNCEIATEVSVYLQDQFQTHIIQWKQI